MATQTKKKTRRIHAARVSRQAMRSTKVTSTRDDRRFSGGRHDDAAVAERDDFVRERRQFGIVRHQHQRAAVPAVDV